MNSLIEFLPFISCTLFGLNMVKVFIPQADLCIVFRRPPLEQLCPAGATNKRLRVMGKTHSRCFFEGVTVSSVTSTE